VRKTKIGTHPKDKTSMFPAWKPYDRVEIIGTGLHGTVMAPVGARVDIFYVRLDDQAGVDSRYARKLVQVNALGMRKDPCPCGEGDNPLHALVHP